MSGKVVMIHTVGPLIDVFNKLGSEVLPGVTIRHILDEPLLEGVRQHGGLLPEDAERLQSHVAEAEKTGADAVLVTCSTISPLVDEVVAHAGVPVFKIDETMIAEAVRLGTRIGVVATANTTLEPTRQLLVARARRAGKAIEPELVLVEGAFAALFGGDAGAHDRLVKAAVLELSPHVDVVILAQASMARVLAVLPEAERPVPVLASPQLALERVKESLLQRARS